MRTILLVAASAAALIASPSIAQTQPAPGSKIPDRYICVFKQGAVARGAEQAAANKAAMAGGGAATHVYTTAIKGFAARIPAHAIERVKAANPNIDYCEQDQIASLVPIRAEAKRPGGGGGKVTQPPQETPWGIARVNGGGSTGPFATAWVIDTGIDPRHPDLFVDTARSKSFVGTTSYADENGHGTHVAGTIAALNNSIGVIGVAPGAPVVAVRVLDRAGSGTTSGVIAGVDYVARTGRPGDVANMSLGGGISTALDSAVLNAAATGIRFALAAGNSSTSATTSSPARVNGANIYTVSSFGAGDFFASFSNYGNPPIDYAEPGVGIKSTWLAGGYNTISGTSMATPHLAGLLLLGPVSNGGTVQGDPDGMPDVIGVK